MRRGFALGIRRRWVRRRAVTVIATVLMLTGVLLVPAEAAYAAMPATSAPELRLHHVLRTTPFAGSNISMKDNEGSAYVGRDNSLWLADDNARMLYEVDAVTGSLKRTIGRKVFEAVAQFGGGPAAGSYRVRDFESLAYDSATDTLYAFSGTCCTSSVMPAVFRLTRRGSAGLQPDSYQPLPGGSEFTAAAWSPADGKLYVGATSDLRSYDYAANTLGSSFSISNVSGIYGLAFSQDGSDLYVARRTAKLSRVDWATKRLVLGWTFDLSPFGLLDTRAVELVGDQLWVSDGYDFRSSGDPLAHAVFVFEVGVPPAPIASFATSASGGNAPLQVAFTDTSTGTPTAWEWHFGDGQLSADQHPSHTYAGAGTFTVTLTASNPSGASTTSATITVSPPATPPPPTASFTSSVTSGTAPLQVVFTDTSTGEPTTWQWDFGDGESASTQSPTHTYTTVGTFTVTLRAANSGGISTAVAEVTASGPPTPQNLVGNPGFEAGTTGWNGPLTRVSGGHSGSWSVQVRNAGTAPATITLNDHPNWAGTTSAGTYTASIWVRSDVAGGKVNCRLREYQGSSKVGETSVQVVLATTWQQVTVSLPAGAPGSSTMDFTTYYYNAPVGSSFLADDAGLRLT